MLTRTQVRSGIALRRAIRRLMKLLKLTSVYPTYVEHLYRCHPGLAGKSYEEQSNILFFDAFAWADSWKIALASVGVEVMEVVANIEPMQRAWAAENLPASFAKADLNTIAVHQVLKFGPDVLWFNDHDAGLLQRIRESVPTIRLVIGWVGSAIPRHNAFGHCDIILSCSRESVERLVKLGYRSAELHHGFDQRILSRLKSASDSYDIIFIGQLIRGADFHVGREALLEDMVEVLPIRIFSPLPPRLTLLDRAKRLIKRGIFCAYHLFRVAGARRLAVGVLHAIGKSEEWTQPPAVSMNSKLKPYISDGIYGLQMYQAIRDSKITLNVHADSSDRYASNMRLFEVTGAGGCLLTDWKSNLSDIFRLDEEVVAYRSPAECIEKAKWLLEHPKACEAIRLAGQARTLREHTYFHRAQRAKEIIRMALRKLPNP